MAGGFAKGLGVTLIVLGAICIVGGLAVAAFGGYVANEESGRTLGDRDKAETAVAAAIGGLIVAGIGLALVLLGLLSYGIGASRARKEMLSAMAPHGPTPLSPPPATPAPRKRAGDRRWPVVAGIIGLALLLLLALAVFQPGNEGTFRPLGVGPANPEPIPPLVATDEGRLQGFRAPLVGASNAGTSDAIHPLRPDREVGTFEALVEWTPETAGSDALVVVLETRTGDSWSETARAEGGPDLQVAAPEGPLGEEVRARVFMAEGRAGDQPYAITLTIR